MAIQLGDTLRNNMINQYESTIGTSPSLTLFTGAQPANCAAADTGTSLVVIPLPADWMTNAPVSGVGTIAKTGTWPATNGAATGVAGYYRIKTSGAVVSEQGSVGVGAGDLQVDQATVTVGQPVTITAWTRTQSGA